MKFSVIASNQSGRAVPSRTRGKCRVRRPMPWPRYGNESTMAAGQAVARPFPRLLLALDDLAALLRALGLRRLDPALALAAVLAPAAVARARALALSLARVDTGAVDHVAAGLPLVGAREGGAPEDQPGRRARNQHSLRSHSPSLRRYPASTGPD